MSVADLAHYLRIYDQDLEPVMCKRMIDSFNTLSRFHQPNGPERHAALTSSAWTELNVTRMSDAGFLGFFRHRIDLALERYNHDIGLPIPVPNSPKIADLIIKRYRPEPAESFQLHFDAVHEAANRYLVLLWYLNDVKEGGQTYFAQLNMSITPQAGRLIVFPPYWMFQHAGLHAPREEKYILSTYLLF